MSQFSVYRVFSPTTETFRYACNDQHYDLNAEVLVKNWKINGRFIMAADCQFCHSDGASFQNKWNWKLTNKRFWMSVHHQFVPRSIQKFYLFLWNNAKSIHTEPKIITNNFFPIFTVFAILVAIIVVLNHPVLECRLFFFIGKAIQRWRHICTWSLFVLKTIIVLNRNWESYKQGCKWYNLLNTLVLLVYLRFQITLSKDETHVKNPN